MENKQLLELEAFVQKLREEGDSDLRTVLWAIRKLIQDPNYSFVEEEEEN
jgi:hypothetical protein